MIAMYLGRMKVESTVQPLIDILQDASEDPELRASAADALSATGDERAISAFIGVLSREDVRFQTEHALRELRKLQAAQHDASGDTAAQLADMVRDLERGRSLHDRILAALRAFRNPSTIAFLLPRLATHDTSHRSSIAAVLGDIGEPALKPLLEAMESEDERVREGAVEALGFMADRQAIPRLANALLQDKQASVRSAAASSLGFIDDDRALAPLAQGLHDSDIPVRQSCAFSLFNLALHGRANAAVLPILAEVARTDEGQIWEHFVVREAAARAINEIERVLNSRG